MKRILHLIALFCLITNISAQYTYQAQTNFETNADLVRIDTSLPNNEWQIGIPQKIYFNSAYSIPKAILTDTMNPYSTNNYSSFYISIKDENWFWGSPSRLSFYHKYDTDSLIDGGYIDVSYNGGDTWLNIIYDSTMYNCTWTPGFGYWGYNFYGDYDTLMDGINGFSGKSDGWINSYFEWYYCIGVEENYPDSMMIRFNFISDSIQSNKEGWMIDDILLFSDICGSVYANNKPKDCSVSISPNPINSTSKLIIHGWHDEKIRLKIIDINGRLLFSDIIMTDEFLLNNLGLSSGLYFYSVKFDSNTILTGKFIKL